jgi:hypothetical protein
MRRTLALLTIGVLALTGCTADPAPSQGTTDGAAQRACLPTPSACGFPDATNTGVPDGTALTMVDGNVALTTAGMVYENQDVRGCVEVHADNVTIRNTRISGSGCQYVLRNFGTNLTVTDSEVTCASGAGTAIASTDYTVTRTDVHGCENGFNVNGRVAVKDSWVHDLFGVDGSHTDGAQFNQGATAIVFEHNTIVSPNPGGTAAIIMWNEGDPQNSNVTIQNNLLAGGAWTLYCPRSDATGVRIVGNRFGAAGYGAAAACTPGHVDQFAGNITDDTGAPLNP